MFGSRYIGLGAMELNISGDSLASPRNSLSDNTGDLMLISPYFRRERSPFRGTGRMNRLASAQPGDHFRSHPFTGFREVNLTNISLNSAVK